MDERRCRGRHHRTAPSGNNPSRRYNFWSRYGRKPIEHSLQQEQHRQKVTAVSLVRLVHRSSTGDHPAQPEKNALVNFARNFSEKWANQ
jgi:hypothetical protein